MGNRIERDSIGEKQIDSAAYYGVQSARAAENFRITGQRVDPDLIDSLIFVKKAAAIANRESGELPSRLADAIIRACDLVLAGEHRDQFITDPIQGGAGTSMNMNANEVIANLAIELLGGEKGDYSVVHPNDHVNMGQSTNDVIPTSGKITLLRLLPALLAELDSLASVLEQKAVEFDGVIKMGRTQLQDAVPVRLGQEFAAYAHVVRRDISRISGTRKELSTVNLGGTAIGTCINSSPKYLSSVVPTLSKLTGLELTQSKDLIDATQNLDAFVVASSALKTCAVDLSKISNDLRLMSSGPRTGMYEINLPAVQNGSSIMPGKVNPVIPEVMSQIAFNIIGNDFTVTMAAEAGQLELNAFEPIIFYKLLESIKTLTNGLHTMVEHCVRGITANRDHCEEEVARSIGIITAVCPRTGYQLAASIAKESLHTGVPVRQLLLSKGILTQSELNQLLDPYCMTSPSAPLN